MTVMTFEVCFCHAGLFVPRAGTELWTNIPVHMAGRGLFHPQSNTRASAGVRRQFPIDVFRSQRVGLAFLPSSLSISGLKQRKQVEAKLQIA